jgi:hypothetical protein
VTSPAVETGRLSRTQWLELARLHDERAGRHAKAALERRSRGRKHAVEDFLFTYYSFPPGRLRQWLPPLGVTLEVEDTDLDRFRSVKPEWLESGNGEVRLRAGSLPERTRELAGWVAYLCDRVLERPAQFRCHGLHEWAMVYGQSQEEVRHSGHSLRLPPAELRAFVDSRTLCCTHYDAFRFFTAEAAPRNVFQPKLETRPELEQGGCLHANMDLYKWSAKLWPWIGSDLVGRAFDFARAGRALDMRASPYDLSALGYDPVRVETAEGRREYESLQRELAARARELRVELAQAARRMAAAVSRRC